jgi:hypothetical protein
MMKELVSMAAVDTRTDLRNSLLLFGQLRLESGSTEHRVRVRNLSDGGMMGDGSVTVRQGNRVLIELRKVGMVPGTVVWVQDQRFGVAFDQDIDSQAARSLDGDGPGVCNTATSYAHKAPPPPAPRQLRTIC